MKIEKLLLSNNLIHSTTIPYNILENSQKISDELKDAWEMGEELRNCISINLNYLRYSMEVRLDPEIWSLFAFNSAFASICVPFPCLIRKYVSILVFLYTKTSFDFLYLVRFQYSHKNSIKSILSTLLDLMSFREWYSLTTVLCQSTDSSDAENIFSFFCGQTHWTVHDDDIL